MGPARVVFLAAILCVCVTAETFKPISWIQPRGNETLIQPKGNNTWVQPRGNETLIQPKGWKSPLTILPKVILGCGTHNLYPGQSVTIQSKNFPSNYPKRYSCIWNFVSSDSASIISISCDTFKLRGCRKSFVKITGGTFNKKYCGNKSGLTATSTTNRMRIWFKTKRGKTKKGFHCTVSASGVTTTPPITTTTPSTTTASPTTTTSPSTTAPPTTTTCRTTAPATSPSTGCEPCGTVNRATRIVGGVETEVNEYPWQVALVFAGTNNAFCGGSIYNDLYIITAAHCGEWIEDNGIDTEVLLGAHDLDNLSSGVQRISVAEVMNHQQYNNNNLNNDIALLKLSSAATLNERVKPACLPDPQNDYDDVNAVVSGWGTTSEDGSQSSVLMEVEVPTMSNADCKSTYGTYASYITENMICAGFAAGGKDSCQGDSGGPLVVEENGKWVLIGVVSWGIGCARPDSPGVYTRVSQYLSELATYTADGQNNLCSTSTSTTTTAAPGTTTTTATTTAAPGTTTTTTTTAAPGTTTPPSSGCKCGHVNTVNRIVGGNPTDVHEYPWQVAMTSSSGSRPFCGGSIISNQWILTAAHCVQGSNNNPSNSRIVIGDHIWNSNSDTTVRERREIEEIIYHTGYNSQTLNNDIALIKLKEPIVFSSDNKIAPICLPPSGNLYSNVDATITGWGTTSAGGSQPSELHEVTVPTMSNSQCQQTDYGSSAITSNMICAGLAAGGKDSCQGDSGGPMVTAGDSANSFLIQIGIVSWGFGCADPNRPGVYTRVNNYLTWISTNTGGLSTCPSA